MAKPAVVVRGLREMMAASKDAGPNVNRANRKALREVGAVVQRDVARRLSPYDTRTAAGVKVGVQQKGIVVYQSVRKTTGKHPEYGSLQMRRGFLPAALAHEDDVVRELERALDKVAVNFERGP